MLRPAKQMTASNMAGATCYSKHYVDETTKGNKMQPFADQGNWTPIHNLILDEIMPRVSGNTYKVLSLVIRRTKGYHQRSAPLSYADIQEGTGIKSEATINKALDLLAGTELFGSALILVKHGESAGVASHKANRYALNRKFVLDFQASKNEACALKNEASQPAPQKKNEACKASKNEVSYPIQEQLKETNTKYEDEEMCETQNANSSSSPSTGNEFLDFILDSLGPDLRTKWQIPGSLSQNFKTKAESAARVIADGKHTLRDMEEFVKVFPEWLESKNGAGPLHIGNFQYNFDAVLQFSRTPRQPTQTTTANFGGKYGTHQKFNSGRGLGPIGQFAPGVKSTRRHRDSQPAVASD